MARGSCTGSGAGFTGTAGQPLPASSQLFLAGALLSVRSNSTSPLIAFKHFLPSAYGLTIGVSLVLKPRYKRKQLRIYFPVLKDSEWIHTSAAADIFSIAGNNQEIASLCANLSSNIQIL